MGSSKQARFSKRAVVWCKTAETYAELVPELLRWRWIYSLWISWQPASAGQTRYSLLSGWIFRSSK